MCIVAAVVGLVGTMLNSRPILGIYNLLLWPAMIGILLVGYTAYRKQALTLDRKLNQAWSQMYNDAARLRIQNNVGRFIVFAHIQYCGTYKLHLIMRTHRSCDLSAAMLWLL